MQRYLKSYRDKGGKLQIEKLTCDIDALRAEYERVQAHQEEQKILSDKVIAAIEELEAMEKRAITPTSEPIDEISDEQALEEYLADEPTPLRIVEIVSLPAVDYGIAIMDISLLGEVRRIEFNWDNSLKCGFSVLPELSITRVADNHLYWTPTRIEVTPSDDVSIGFKSYPSCYGEYSDCQWLLPESYTRIIRAKCYLSFTSSDFRYVEFLPGDATKPMVSRYPVIAHKAVDSEGTRFYVIHGQFAVESGKWVLQNRSERVNWIDRHQKLMPEPIKAGQRVRLQGGMELGTAVFKVIAVNYLNITQVASIECETPSRSFKQGDSTVVPTLQLKRIVNR